MKPGLARRAAWFGAAAALAAGEAAAVLLGWRPGPGPVRLPAGVLTVAGVLLAVQGAVVASVALDPRRAEDLRRGTGRLARRLGREPTPAFAAHALAALGAGLGLAPVAVGFVVYALTGDRWRFLVFLPFAAAAGARNWVRVGRVLPAVTGPDR